MVELACGPAERFQPSVEMLEQAHAAAPLAGLVVASPANPTGTMIAPDHLAELAAWCRDHEVRLVSDEIYHGITDRTVAASCAWEHDREAIVISSFSKYWGMTGWRLGWSLVPADLVAAFDALAGNFTPCARRYRPSMRRSPPSPRSPTEKPMLRSQPSQTPGRLCWQPIDDLGWTGVAPADGAFYVYAGIASQLGPVPRLRSRGARRCWSNMAWRSLRAPTSINGMAAPPSASPSPPAPRQWRAALIRILRFQQSLKSSR